MQRIEKFVPLLGRILLTLIFFTSGLGKIGGWEQTAGYMSSKGIPLVSFFLIGAILIEVGGGMSVLLGYKAKIGATALVVFLIPVTILFHNFWTLEGMEQQVQMIMFMKNLTIIGGLLLVVTFGSGPISFDSRKKDLE